MGIPIFTPTHDLFFAQGYVHPRIVLANGPGGTSAGRVSEMFTRGIPICSPHPWLGRSHKKNDALEPQYKAMVESYTDGVNAYLKDHDKEALSLEYAVLGLLNADYKIESWTPSNTLTWGKMLAYDLRGNMDEEIKRAILLKNLTPEQVDELFPAYPEDHPVIVNKIGDGSSALTNPTALAAEISNEMLDVLYRNVTLLDELMGPFDSGVGSNSWVIGGALTTTGMPLLANDPHLAIQMPSIWYQIGLHCKPKTADCPYDVAGFSMAGVPAVIIGHNDKIAWGFTVSGPDVMDLHDEKSIPKTNQYEVNGEWVDFESARRSSKSRAAIPSKWIHLRHGPVISEVSASPKRRRPEDEKFIPSKILLASNSCAICHALATAFTVSSSFVAPCDGEHRRKLRAIP